MKKLRNEKKLTLTRETLLSLSDRGLTGVAAGATVSICEDSCRATCECGTSINQTTCNSLCC